MKRKKLLLATAALTTAISCGGKKKEPQIYANPKGGHYDRGLADAGVDAPPAPDAPAADTPLSRAPTHEDDLAKRQPK